MAAHVASRDVGAFTQAERDHATRAAREAMPERSEAIVGVDHRRAVRPERFEHLALAPGDAVDAAESFEVRLAGIDHQADRRLGDRGQVRDFAQVVRAHLDDGATMRVLEPAQRERHADVVVQVALRHEARAELGQDRAGHFLDRRLAVAAGDADDDAGERTAPGIRECGQAGQRVGDDDLRQRAIDRTTDDRAGGAELRGIGDEVVTVEAFARERDEQRARLQGTRVADDARKRRIGAMQDAAAHLGEGCEVAADHAAPPDRQACTVSRSLNARVSVPTIW